MKTLYTFIAIILTLTFKINAQWINGQNASVVLGTSGSYTSVGTLNAVGIAIDATNNKVYVSDYCNHVVYRYATTSGNLTSSSVKEATFGVLGVAGTSSTRLRFPSGLAVDNNGRLIIVDGGNHRLVYIDNAKAAASGVAFSGFFGQNDVVTGTVNSGAGAASNKSFNFAVSSPSGIFSCTSTTFAGYLAISPTNQLFVSDPGNNRIMRFDNTSSINADVVFGQPNFPSVSAGTTVSTLRTPMGIALSGSALFVADMNNNRVIRYDNATTLSTNQPSAAAVFGQTSFTTATGSRTSSTFDIPINVATDATGTVYINDSNNGRTVFVKSASTKNGGGGIAVAFDGVIGQSNFTSYAGTANQATMWAGVTGLAVNSKNGKMLIANTGFGRVLQFNASAPLPLDFLSLHAMNVNNKLMVKWVTTNEINTHLFEIEHSNNGFNFMKVAEHLSVGNNLVHQNTYYSHLPNLIHSNQNYFRIKQIDLDGKYAYSDIFSYHFMYTNKLHVYPNYNVENHLNYHFDTENNDIQMIIVSTSGDLVFDKILNQMKGSIDVSGFKSGVYIIKAMVNNQSYTSTFVKQ